MPEWCAILNKTGFRTVAEAKRKCRRGTTTFVVDIRSNKFRREFIDSSSYLHNDRPHSACHESRQHQSNYSLERPLGNAIQLYYYLRHARRWTRSHRSCLCAISVLARWRGGDVLPQWLRFCRRWSLRYDPSTPWAQHAHSCAVAARPPRKCASLSSIALANKHPPRAGIVLTRGGFFHQFTCPSQNHTEGLCNWHTSRKHRWPCSYEGKHPGRLNNDFERAVVAMKILAYLALSRSAAQTSCWHLQGPKNAAR